MAFLPSGEALLIAGPDGSIDSLDTTTWLAIGKMPTQTALSVMAISPDGDTMITGGLTLPETVTSKGEVKIWDVSKTLNKPPLLHTIRGTTTDYPAAISISPDGLKFAVSWIYVRNAACRNGATIYEVTTAKRVATLRGITNCVESLSFSPDGKTLIIQDVYGSLLNWDWETGQQIKDSTNRQNNGGLVGFSFDGKKIAVAGPSGIDIRDTATGTARMTISCDTELIAEIKLSPNGKILAATLFVFSESSPSFLETLLDIFRSTQTTGQPSFNSKGALVLWDVETGNLLVTLQKNGPGIQSLAFSPNGKWIAVGDEKGVVSIWDVAEVLAHDQQ